MGKVVGASVTRIEDEALLTGKSCFVGDIKLPGMLHAAFVRSPHAHARIIKINASAAQALPGVVAVLTGADIGKIVKTDRLVVALPDRSYKQQRDRVILALHETVYVGEAIAMVIATDAYIAEDATSLVDIEFEQLRPVSDCRAALAPDAPAVHSDAKDNLVAAFSTGYGDIDSAFKDAPYVLRDSFWLHRGGAHPIECRGCIAAHEPIDDKLTIWSSTQTPLVAVRLLADILGREESSIRVAAPDVGGGFGPKLVFYPEEAAVAVAALLLKRPVKWIEDRREHFLATTQERDQYWDVAIAIDADGKIRGIKGSLLHDHGAYTARGLTVPQAATLALPLAYVVPAYRLDVQVALTNKVPVTPVRGAGQPQGVFIMERLLDRAAEASKLGRDEIRRRNLVPASSMPFKTGLTERGGFPITLDSGDYAACQAKALALAKWDDFPRRQREARAANRYLGIGMANFVEPTGRGPYEQVRVSVARSGLIDVATGAAAMGQSTKTMIAQIVAEQLGGEVDRVVVSAGDSGKIARGFGGFNSRQTVMAGSSAHAAAVKVRDKALLVASLLMEVDPVDLEIEKGFIVVKGAEDKRISLGQVAETLAGAPGFSLPNDLPPGLDATESVIINVLTYGNGTAIAEVDVDVETFSVKVNRIVFIHDAGNLINPTIAEGQIVGAVVHGLSNSLYEWMIYDENAEPLTTTFADYLMVTASEIPEFELGHMETPTPLNELGVKGIGESGVMPIPAAIASAIEDALKPFGIRINQFPVRPSYLYECITTARR